VELFCRISGSGPPLIILHGLLGMSDNWHSLATDLSQHYTVYIPDLRNHGQSPHSPQFDYEYMLNDLVDIIDKNDITKPFIIGHSMGGKLAMLFALRFPGITERLVVVDIHPGKYRADDSMLHMIETMRSMNLSDCNSFAEAEQYLLSRISNPVLVQLILKNIRRYENKKLIWKPDVHAIYNNLSSITEAIGNGLSSNVPALFIRGSKSAYITTSDHTSLLMKFPAAVIQTIEDAGHWIHADKPVEFLAAVKYFLQK
jgi:pimeloyl-ACP methyl ester carboxylesterase